jgi:tetratricopeptide (TPR) repeat protein
MVQDIESLQARSVDDLLHDGIAAAKSGQRQRARDLLTRVADRDQRNVVAWLWLSSVMDQLEEREICLKNALILDPDNAAARKGLVWVEQQKEAQVSSSADEFDDAYLCPYCAAPTEPDDRKCRACGGDLWVGFRLQEGRSNALWFAIGAQAATLIRNASVFFPALATVSFVVQLWTGVSDLKGLMRLYLGSSSDLPSEVTELVFSLLPRSVFFAYGFFFLFSAAVMVGLFSRWKPVFFLFLADAVLNLVGAVISLSLGQLINEITSMILPTELFFFYLTSIAGVVLGGLKFYLAFQIVDDFFLTRRRILLGVAPGLTDGADLVMQADFYAKHKMWAMAAAHLRRAINLVPERPDCHRALAAAYIRLKRYDLAAQELAEAKHISPGDPRVAQLEALLGELRAAGSSS